MCLRHLEMLFSLYLWKLPHPALWKFELFDGTAPFEGGNKVY